eukprot:CAMPEP_0174726830 /NCGR_PEP_ID=MMETSP1094-20130205/48561_1 /TAXON_ID=156173 /ORGANISM="Chrysochromulina brevifilum, Strain UTEX LB 985" /LENGTH=53 /DNA_ID=CAMNT_0015928455 /DNA_START=295 /DNA_END=453 /DNA_ORIENTATION=+
MANHDGGHACDEVSWAHLLTRPELRDPALCGVFIALRGGGVGGGFTTALLLPP